MIALALTGSIGMGKSATAQLFREEGVPVYDADASVHALYATGGAAVAQIEAAFPGTTTNGAVDRTKLRARALGDASAMAQLEAIVHPLTAASQRTFRAHAAEANAPLIVLDIPLLYETGGDARTDYVLVVTAPPDMQRARVMARPGMTEETYAAMMARQVSDAEKRARADFVLSTGFGFEYARDSVRALIGLMQRLNMKATT